MSHVSSRGEIVLSNQTSQQKLEVDETEQLENLYPTIARFGGKIKPKFYPELPEGTPQSRHKSTMRNATSRRNINADVHDRLLQSLSTLGGGGTIDASKRHGSRTDRKFGFAFS